MIFLDFAEMYMFVDENSILQVFIFSFSELPKLNKLSIPQQLSIESRAKLLCVVSSGDQPIEFNWVKDGKPFSGGRIEQLDEWTSSLTLEPLSLSHIGNYTCVASNDAGTSKVTASVFVTGTVFIINIFYLFKILFLFSIYTKTKKAFFKRSVPNYFLEKF